MTRHVSIGIIFSLVLLTITACGGGSTGTGTATATSTSTSTSTSTATTAYTNATVKIGLTGSTGGKGIAGTGFTLTLPANVAPAMDNGSVATGTVTCSGTFAGSTLAQIIYTPATGSTQGILNINVANIITAGVTAVGEVATVTLKLSNGASPAATDFSLNSISVIDTLGSAIKGVTATVSGVALN